MAPYTYRILARAAGAPRVRPGECHTFPVERRLLYAWPGLSDWFAQTIDQKLGGEVPEPDKVYMTFDHMLPVRSAAQDRFVSQSRAWARAKGFRISEGEGIGHILAIQEGWVRPGMVVPHFDTHVSAVGAIGALGVGLLKEMLFPLATGRLWLEVPPLLRVELTGRLQGGVMGRDLLHTLVRDLGLERCGGMILEFGGPGARSMALDDRVAVCNLINYLGAVSAVFDLEEGGEAPDEGFADHVAVALEEVEPTLAAPPSTANAVPLSQAAGVPVDMGIIGTCAGGGLGDLAAAARVLQGKRLAPGRALYVSPATAAIQRRAMELGYLRVLLDAGCFLSSPTCDFCYGAAAYLGEGKTAISTQTLNVNGRLGSLKGDIYLGSAAAVAAALARGEICDPRSLWNGGA